MSETRTFIGKLMLYETHALKQAMLRKQDWVKFRGRIAWQSFFFENNFADFSNVVGVKKNPDFAQPLLTFLIRNISNCLF